MGLNGSEKNCEIDFIKIFKSHLRSNNVDLIQNAISNFRRLATTAGVEKTNETLLPFISEIAVQTNLAALFRDVDEQDPYYFFPPSLLISVVRSLNADFLTLIGGISNIDHLFNVLFHFAGFYDLRVRTTAVNSIKSFFTAQKWTEIEEKAVKLIFDLLSGDHSTNLTKLSGLSLADHFFKCCDPANSLFKIELKPIVRQFLRLTLQTLKNGNYSLQSKSCDVIVRISLFLDKKSIQKNLVPLLQNMHNCYESATRAYIVDFCAIFIEKLDWKSIKKYQIIECLKRCSSNHSFEIRQRFVSHFCAVQKAVLESGDESLPLFFLKRFLAILCEDEELLVFEMAVRSLPDLIKLCKSQHRAIIYEAVTKVWTGPNENPPSERRGFLCGVLPVLIRNEEEKGPKEALIDLIVTGDPEINDNDLINCLLKQAPVLYEGLGETRFLSKFLPKLKKMSASDNWSFRRINIDLLSFLSEKMNRTSFDQSCAPILVGLVKDPTAEIREKAVDLAVEIGARFGAAWMEENLIKLFEDVVDNNRYRLRMMPLYFLRKHAHTVPDKMLKNNFFEILIILLADPVRNVAECARKVARALYKRFPEKEREYLKNKL